MSPSCLTCCGRIARSMPRALARRCAVLAVLFLRDRRLHPTDQADRARAVYEDIIAQ
jgi:hypothetical protein